MYTDNYLFRIILILFYLKFSSGYWKYLLLIGFLYNCYDFVRNLIIKLSGNWLKLDLFENNMLHVYLKLYLLNLYSRVQKCMRQPIWIYMVSFLIRNNLRLIILKSKGVGPDLMTQVAGWCGSTMLANGEQPYTMEQKFTRSYFSYIFAPVETCYATLNRHTTMKTLFPRDLAFISMTTSVHSVIWSESTLFASWLEIPYPFTS